MHSFNGIMGHLLAPNMQGEVSGGASHHDAPLLARAHDLETALKERFSHVAVTIADDNAQATRRLELVREATGVLLVPNLVPNEVAKPCTAILLQEVRLELTNPDCHFLAMSHRPPLHPLLQCSSTKCHRGALVSLPTCSCRHSSTPQLRVLIPAMRSGCLKLSPSASTR